MSNLNKNQNYISKIAICTFIVAIITISFLSLSYFSNNSQQKLANAAIPPLPSKSSNLIIGTSDTGSAIELSLCVQATPGPINLANVSSWFQFDSSSLTTVANSILEKGQYGNSNNGYGPLKWQEVLGSQSGNLKTYSMRLDYTDLTGGMGLPMSTSKELFGKVSFVKTGSYSSINLVKNQFFSTANASVPLDQEISYVSGDCRTSTVVITQSSTQLSSSLATPSSQITFSSRMTNSSVTPPGNCINGQPNPPGCVCPPGQMQDIVKTGQYVFLDTVVGCKAITNSSSMVAISSTAAITITITPNAPVPNIRIPIEFTLPGGLPNNAPAIFSFPGSSVSIAGMISNNIFIPNAGQIVPSDVLTFYGSNSFGVGKLTLGSQTYNIPTKVVNSSIAPSTGGGSIIIALSNSAVSSVTSSSISSNSVLVTPVTQSDTQPKTESLLQSKLKITDPYICGVGSYGNVNDAKQFGVENVYYDLYQKNSSTPSYSYKLKINENGDFFLPISSLTNKIAQGDYRFVYYASEKLGNKAQGEFNALITDNCNNNTTSDSSNSVRTGGSQYLLTVFSTLTLFVIAFSISRSNNKSYSLNSIFGKK